MDENLKNKVINCELMCMKLFTNYIVKDYGILFYNEDNKESHDSNHAILYENKISDLEVILNDIKVFYLSKGLVPRIYQTCDGYFKSNEVIFRKCGFMFLSFDLGINKFSILNAECKINVANRLKIYRLTKYDERILTDIFAPIDAEYDAITIKKAITNEDFHFFVGELDNRFITCASLYYFDGLCRIDHVATASGERKKGYCRELIKYIVNNHNDNYKDSLMFEWPTNNTAECIYFEAGFRYAFSKENITAYFK